MSNPHDHDHHHTLESVTTPPRQLTRAENKQREIRTKAIESLLLEKQLVTAATLDAVIKTYEDDLGPLNGAKVVARAWVDPVYKERLLLDGTAAIAELGFGGLQGERLVVVENTPTAHNVISCVLCSCYPWPVLGLPPFWYKSQAYRSRIGGNTREVLREFGLELDAETEIFVWNSSAQTRYMVLPATTNGNRAPDRGRTSCTCHAGCDDRCRTGHSRQTALKPFVTTPHSRHGRKYRPPTTQWRIGLSRPVGR